jgi:hypothetical protein
MSGEPSKAPIPEHDRLLQATCDVIVREAAQAIDATPPGQALVMKTPDGQAVGKQITIDASETKGQHNICRLAVLNAELAPAGEVTRIEYEHDKQTKYGTTRVYSIQSVRMRGGKLVLMENFLADSPAQVREQDFEPIESESYAQQTVWKTLQEWTHYHRWQMQQQKGKK